MAHICVIFDENTTKPRANVGKHMTKIQVNMHSYVIYHECFPTNGGKKRRGPHSADPCL